MNYHYVWYAVGLIIILLVVWMIGKAINYLDTRS